ncbi:MAG TPA: hypothetical protein VM265_03610 [Sphingomicrobium sp.]|nr:hypothetical protein [Sphingomicrobium sp.]
MTDRPEDASEATTPPRAVTRRREDTSLGCREMAADDRVRADATDTAHMRLRMESSADAWTTRADMLQRLERSHDARAAANAATAAADAAEDSSG